MELTARIQIEEGSYWADISELPGCFASGDTWTSCSSPCERASRFTSWTRVSRVGRCALRR
jgi:hypothetical protein